MRTIHDFLPYHKAMDGDVGFELEVESAKPYPVPERGPWEVKGEGSLRNNGAEFVSREPFKVDLVNFPRKISKLCEAVNKPEFGVIKDCPRTSLHVHCNVLRDTPVQVWTKATAYWLFEDVLTKFCGEEQREGNQFCLRVSDAEGILEVALRDLRGKKPFRAFDNDDRYAGQNLAAVAKFGSIEYRSMRGTTDPSIITTWASNLWAMSESSKTYASPASILDKYYHNGAEYLMESLFAKDFCKELKKFKGWEELVEASVFPLLAVGYHTDWASWSKRIDSTGVVTKEDPYIHERERARLRRGVRVNFNAIPDFGEI